MVTITYFPPELLQLVISHLHVDDPSDHPDYGTLRSLCLCNKHLAQTCTPSLYSRIVMHAVPNIGALMATLTQEPQLGGHIKSIVLEGDVRFSPVFWALFSARTWIIQNYSYEFYHFLKRSVIKDTLAADCMLAMLLVLSPELRTLTWTRDRRLAAVTAIFKFKLVLDRPERLLAKLETITSFNSSATIRARKPKERTGEIEPFFLTSQLKNVSVSHILCTRDRISVPTPTSRGATLSRLPSTSPSESLADLDPTEARSFTFDLSRIDVPVFRSLFQIAPQLESLTLTDHFFELPSEAVADRDTTLATLGASLSGVPNLRKLEIRHRANHPFQKSLIDRGRIGSLTPLAALEQVIIDPAFLLGDDYAVDEFLAPLLPTSVKSLCFLPRQSAPLAQLRGNIENLIGNEKFTRLQDITVEGAGFTIERVDGTLKIIR